MGTHKKAPAHLWNNAQKLSELISANPDGELGPKIISKFGSQLPFLLKILSVDRALSIQAHPNKSAAEILHERDPAHYPDANHKPEMCIALTDFTGLCGFRPAEETAKFTNCVPELTHLIGHETAQGKQKYMYTPTRIKGRAKNRTGDQFWRRTGRARMDGRQFFGVF